MQRLLGLELTVLKPPLDALAALGFAVTQAHRLGDHCLHRGSGGKTRRHKAGLRAVYTALTALETQCLPHGTISLGDRDDRTTATREAARLRHGHLNAKTVPDLYRTGLAPHQWEYTVFCEPSPETTT